MQGTKAKYARPTSFTFPQPTAQPGQQPARSAPAYAAGAAYAGQPGAQAGGVPAQGPYTSGQQGAPAGGVPYGAAGHYQYTAQAPAGADLVSVQLQVLTSVLARPLQRMPIATELLCATGAVLYTGHSGPSWHGLSRVAFLC